jgi:DNA-binding MurR/RpiR family transcriptional regulator
VKPFDGKLTPKQEAALLALLDNGTIEAAYKAAGISKATMWRFMQDANFQTRYRQARRQLVETAIAQLQSDCTIAVRVLREVAEDTEAPASSRVAAAKTIIEQSVAAIELTDLQERLERLEELEAARAPETAKGRFRA